MTIPAQILHGFLLRYGRIAITLDLYSHVTPSIARDAANVVASRILSRPL